jgi:hypothetical protein
MALFSCGDSECHRCSAQPGPVVAEQTEFSWARVAEDAAPVHSPTTKAVVKRQGFIASSSKKKVYILFKNHSQTVSASGGSSFARKHSIIRTIAADRLRGTLCRARQASILSTNRSSTRVPIKTVFRFMPGEVVRCRALSLDNPGLKIDSLTRPLVTSTAKV